MSSISNRHTYYGGGSNTQHTTNMVRSPSDRLSKLKRKQITFGPYYIGSTLGEGEFGKVKLGWTRNPTSNQEVSKQVAIKLIRRDKIVKNSEKEIKIFREINALKHLTHPNIVKLEEVLQNSKYIGIVLEYASGGEFYRYIQRKRRLKETAGCRLFTQLVSGVNYMHSKGLVHRDLKLENLLLDKHENLVITDFGFVNEFLKDNDLMKTSCGSPCYAAPELVISTKPYEARKADIWSCGIILYAMLAGYLPWDDDPQNPEGDDIARLYYFITRTSLKFPEYISPIPRDLLRRLLVSDPRKRLNIRQIQQHEWLRPHSEFLSITPEDWDNKMKTEVALSNPQQNNEKLNKASSVESSTSKYSNSDKRDTLIIDTAMLLSPVPPQEYQSYIITKPSSVNEDTSSSTQKNKKMHSRSNSAASIALQAVVDAELEASQRNQDHINTVKNEVNRNENMNTKEKRSNNNSDNKKQEYINLQQVSRNDTMQDRSMGIRAEFIRSAGNNEREDIQLKKVETNYNGENSTRGSHNSGKHRKPRPTSYHPGSSSGRTNLSPYDFNTFNTNTESSTKKVISQLETLQFDSTPSLIVDTEATGMPVNSSPKILSQRSFSMSKPSLDLQSVTADLIKFQGENDSAAKSIHEHVMGTNWQYVPHSISSPKNSLGRTPEEYDSSLQHPPSSGGKYETVLTDSNTSYNSITQESEKSKTSPMYEAYMFTDVSTQRDKIKEEKKGSKKRFSILSFYSSYNNNSKTSFDSSDTKSRADHSSIGSPQLTPGHATQGRADLSVRDRNTRMPSMTNNTNNSHLKNERIISQAESDIEDVYRRRSSKPIKNDKRYSSIEIGRDNTANKIGTRNKRASMMVPNLQEHNTNIPELRPQREQSTAKKVIDFFKRRSMRL
ncbi:hypothetical protein Kpol_1072p29 [Vanderwaltozyma polyspora DSM 70294]|uniref:non-specific serine/threonine protein kinase n=1 Tax=Vanderwaltozyma polyspora (strain ATCC 22028 / DSM 70294 / BCRC 21397 / CBS 2163 / NBRC 10782 / NRRL Y-8283 / UCD 57-17) TaxID=436907 RepID=A7TKP7_VANPO|nr:uncharacterized protein Kpol_1072p29 [Vanderwaltozyma polyspora DSM 70294]EDO17159.1 hypothetical protein Kpol_1072p29 [Vanderwaltozyma polyspora DSM 70294]